MIYSSLTRGFVMRLFQGAAYKPKSAFIKKMSDGTCPPINIRRCSCTSDGLSVSPKKSLTSPIWDRRPSKILDENHLPKQLLVQHHHEDGAFLRNISATNAFYYETTLI
ncbi:ANK_REP_REGION domain-containing protein [Caenorhabditis elegans]|uniref:ANK_REP_REGION domain-containing protein n=1 Tax=Caenorhabditis elegans TaxID=6239 RepID=P90759_CAEEL|nr:ANK_REP_REGION domain-containing protein [Caenorhabditis elegans]CAB02789.1 ANK_REP_REGION domain-containing protein [Caenorhabditis elegans]|eukprot:NP_506050.1 Uncharacterized protein CELE_C27A7.5 [Caenorhabditis elegans]